MFEIFLKNFIEKQYYLLMLQGVATTLVVTTIALIIGFLLGIILVLMQLIVLPKKLKFLQKILNGFSKFYVEFIRGTPVMVQLTFIWIVIFDDVIISKIIVGGIAFGLNSAAYMAEIMKSGIRSIDKGQMEAGLSLGLSHSQTFRYIILPQAFKNVLPSFINEFVSLIKETSILCVIGGIDLMRSGDIIIANTGNAIYPLIFVASLYLILTTFFTMIMKKVAKRLKVDEDKLC